MVMGIYDALLCGILYYIIFILFYCIFYVYISRYINPFLTFNIDVLRLRPQLYAEPMVCLVQRPCLFVSHYCIFVTRRIR